MYKLSKELLKGMNKIGLVKENLGYTEEMMDQANFGGNLEVMG